MQKAVLYEKLKNDSVKCTACSWYCSISDGSVGICATRLNKKGILYSLVYGKAVGLHMDPVEKKPLYHFLPGAKVLSFGTLGCNFGCLFCQNWDISQINKNQESGIRNQESEKSLISLIDRMSVGITPKEIVEMALEKGAQGIAYTYNEPAIFAEFTHDTAKLAKKNKLKNIYVSNGFESKETFDFIKDFIDAINIDLKSFRDDFYRKICKSKIGPVLENIERFFEYGIETEVTTLIIPGHNDSKKELSDIANFLAKISKDIPWHISAFYPAFKMRNVIGTSHETLIAAYNAGKAAGLKYIYVGNVRDEDRSSTICPNCGNLLVSRAGYYTKVENIDINKGKCKKCKEEIYGIWN